MARYVLRGVLPALAAAAVVLILLVAACGFVNLGLSIAAAMKFDMLGKAVNIAFIAFLFVFATGIVPCIVLKKLQITNLPVYLLTGSVCGVLAEYCYLFNDEFWFGWDFSEPTFMSVLASAIRDMPDLLAGMVPMLPWSAIPVAVGLLGSGLYWIRMRRGFGGKALGNILPALWRSVFAVLVVAGVFAVLFAALAAIMYGALAASVNNWHLAGFFSYILIGFTLLMVTAVLPCVVLRKTKIRIFAVYLATGLLAGFFAEYCWLFAFSINESLWSWVHVVTASDGSGYDRTPSFLSVLSAVYSYAPGIFARHILTLRWSSAGDPGIGAFCSSLFWLAFVWWPARRARHQQSTQ